MSPKPALAHKLRPAQVLPSLDPQPIKLTNSPKGSKNSTNWPRSRPMKTRAHSLTLTRLLFQSIRASSTTTRLSSMKRRSLSKCKPMEELGCHLEKMKIRCSDHVKKIEIFKSHINRYIRKNSKLILIHHLILARNLKIRGFKRYVYGVCC